MSDATKPVEFPTKFKDVKFSVVPEDKRVNPEALHPQLRPAYDRIVAAGGDKFVSMTENGDLRVSGTFTQIRANGETKPGQVFVAYTSLTKNGNVIDFAGDMVTKFSSPETVGFAKVRVVPGREDGKGGRFRDLKISFPQTEAERASWLASRGAVGGQKAQTAATSKERVADDIEIPF